jgi:hypothetical protein
MAIAHTPAVHAPFAATPQPVATSAPTAGPPKDNQQLGLFIGVAIVALVSLMCLASAFMCVMTGILR